MIQTGFDTRIKIQQIVENQLPEFILDESPKTVDFLKQYYISQEYQSGPVDIGENLDKYIKVELLDPEIIGTNTKLTADITSESDVISVESTKGYPNTYGLFKIDNEIITYTGITTNSFTGCVRGFSGISSYHDSLDQGELVFETTSSDSHVQNSTVVNLSKLFLTEFYNKLRYTFTPGLENYNFVPELNSGTFISRAKDFYKSKGTEASFDILFKILYNEKPKIVNLEQYVIKPSSANYIKRKIVVISPISGNPVNLIGQGIKKSTNDQATGSVSNVEAISRNGQLYYKLDLYIDNEGDSGVDGVFSVTPQTRTIEKVSIGSSVITVDSTISFGETGKLVVDDNTITYEYKTINQFLGCVGVDPEIEIGSNITSDEYYYGYENGDKNKEVRFRLTSIISKFVPKNTFILANVGELISVGGVGKEIKNPPVNKKYSEIFSNSLIYNTTSRYFVKYVGSNTFDTQTIVDKSSLKVGDEVEILIRGTQNIVSSEGCTVSSIPTLNRIILTNLLDKDGLAFNPGDPSKSYFNLDLDIRRKLKKASSSGTNIEFGNNVLCNIQNVYTDDNNDLYIASNSLPEYPITNSIFELTIPEISSQYITNRDTVKEQYTSITFDFSPGSENFSKGFSSVPFLTGDKIYYTPGNSPIVGLKEGEYYIKVLDSSTIRLYDSLSFVDIDDYIEIDIPINPQDCLGAHTFSLSIQKGKKIFPQKILKKFPNNQTSRLNPGKETVSGATGILINGVEILNYKFVDKVYYGPIKSAKIVSGGEGYDVINPPEINISNEVGNGAKIQPVVSGSFKDVLIDLQEFDLDKIVSIGVSGGNGSGAVFEPIIEARSRKVYFKGNNIDLINEVVLFDSPHYFFDGEPIVYSSNSNSPLGIGNFKGSNASSGKFLKNSNIYYPKVINSKSIILYPSLLDYNSGINTVGFTTINAFGTHLFQTLNNKKYLTKIKVVDSGSGYTNRKLIVKPAGISTENHTISFKNHGFKTGETVIYNYQSTPIVGLSSNTEYKVLVLDNDSFRLSDCGIGCTNLENFNLEKYSKIYSKGTGYQYFSYPEIKVNISINSGIVTFREVVGVITATPVVRGEIIDAYVYEEGQNYGSDVINLNKKPIIKVIPGNGAEIVPVLSLGSIINTQINFGGINYSSVPDLVVEGDGSGASLRAVVKNKRIVEVRILNPGIGYSYAKIKIVSPGKNAIIDVFLRDLTVNLTSRFGNDLIYGDNSLQYFTLGYNSQVRSSLGDDSETTLAHSPIIGWAYDGNPIYGSFGLSDPNDSASSPKRLVSSYQLDASSVTNRPSIFPEGFFVEDYVYTNSGDLDECNGRYTKTPEFPDGIYAYFTTTKSAGSQIIPSFPYFIGNRYRNEYVEENKTLNQSFDFNNSSLLRNTFPYKANDLYASNDGFIESFENTNQSSIIESTLKGVIDGFEILNAGTDYRVGDSVVFKEDVTGSGLDVKVNTVDGKEILDIKTTLNSYDNVVLKKTNKDEIQIKVSPYHNFDNADYVNISGLTSGLNILNKTYQIGVTSFRTVISKDILSNSQPGIITDIYVSNIPETVSIGSSIKINSEIFGIIDIIKNQNILRVRRSQSDNSYVGVNTVVVDYLPDTFTIKETVDDFDSSFTKQFFFNPQESVGVSTIVGAAVTSLYSISGKTSVGIGTTSSTPLIRNLVGSSIYLQNHKIKTGDLIRFSKPINADYFSVESGIVTTGISTFRIPLSESDINSQTFYAINNGGDFIGLSTEYGPVGQNLLLGLYGKKYTGYFADSLTFFNSSNDTGITTNIHQLDSYGLSDTNFSWQFFGYYKSTNTGINTITVTSTGSAYLWLGSSAISGFTTNNALVSAPGTGTKTAVGSTSLIKDKYYPIRIVSGRNAAGTLTVKAESVGIGSTTSFIFYNTQEVLTLSTEPKPLVFLNRGSSNVFDYQIQTVDNQVLGKVNRIEAKVSVSTDHGLKIGDTVTLTVEPNKSIGIGTTSPLAIKLDSFTNKIINQTTNIEPSGINTNNNIIQVPNHIFKTGDKVLYNSTTTVASGLSTGTYFVLVVDKDNIQLSETYKSLEINPPKVVSFGGTIGGSGQTISKINPELNPIIGNNLSIDLSDDSLRGYNFKLFSDKEFQREFISIANTNSFSVSGVGSVGYSGSQLTLKYSNDLPKTLFYSLEKSGEVISPDNSVKNASQINYIKSSYSGEYKVSEIGINTVSSSSTTFTVNLLETPESLSYDNEDCSTIKYSTSSKTALGPINNVKVLSTGSNYTNLPSFETVDSQTGVGAFISPTTSTIGKIVETKLFNQGYEYSSDKTLRPFSKKIFKCSIKNYQYLEDVTVTSGGSGYLGAPDIIFADKTGEIRLTESLLEAKYEPNTVTDVNIINKPYGTSSNPLDFVVAAVNNTNGVSVDTAQASSVGIVTCTLTTPVLGFSQNVFNVGEKVFVEGIKRDDDSGTGINSVELGFNFFEVVSYSNTIPAVVELDISNYTNDPGSISFIQDSFASIIKASSYPTFSITLSPVNLSPFVDGEKLKILVNNNFIDSDLILKSFDSGIVLIEGNDDLRKGTIVRGSSSGALATISEIFTRDGIFETDYSTEIVYNWVDDIGKLSDNVQFIFDSDYYQNLSYSIRSSLQYENLNAEVNSLLHPAGFKNFADTQIEMSAESGDRINGLDQSTFIYDLQEEKRVDTINNYVFGIDYSVNTTLNASKFIKLKNKKLSSYIKCITNRALQIDDISTQFTNNDTPAPGYADLFITDSTDNYGQYLIQITNSVGAVAQLTDVVIIVNNNNDVFTLQKASLTNAVPKIGEIDGFIDDFQNFRVRFDPIDPFNEDYDIKTIKTSVPNTSSTGIGSTSIGFVNIQTSSKFVSSGITTSILEFDANYRNIVATVQLTDLTTNTICFAEAYIVYDGTDTYITRYDYETYSRTTNFSNEFLGDLIPSVDDGVLRLNYLNDTDNSIRINTRATVFGPTSLGIGTFYFVDNGQPFDSVRSARYESKFTQTSASSSVGIVTYSRQEISSFRAKVCVSVGSSSELHQFLVLDVYEGFGATYTTQYPLLSINDYATGIGTFGIEKDDFNYTFKFYKNPQLGTANVEIKYFAEAFYNLYETINIPEPLVLGPSIDTFVLDFYNGAQANRINRLDYDANYEGIPIFEKRFNPANETRVNYANGTITIPNHFYQTGEN
jgi:hypothetical protein